jgi:uncharacterized protein (TIGR03663 family)
VLLDARPLHHDEGVNAEFLSSLLKGYQYGYDPAKFHGPFLYFFTLPFVWLLGESVFALRLPVVLASALMVPLLLPLRRRLGVAGVTAAAWLLALSPAFVSYGRDLIHETFLAALTLALVVAASLWLESRREGWLYTAAVCLGLLATVKETYVVTVAVLAIAAVLARTWGHGRPGLRELWGHPRPGTAKRALAAFAVPYVLLYSSFLTHLQGVLDSFRTFLYWTGRGVEGGRHAKPWDYFPRLLFSFEAAAVVCALAGGWLALRRRDAFGTFCLLWAAGELAAYSLLSYKTPWLVLNIVLPAALTAGVLFREAFAGRAPAFARAGLVAALALGLAWEGWRAVEVSFLRFDDPRLALVYVPTHRDVNALLAQVHAAAGRIPPGRKPEIYILGRYAWPLPWYLRDLPGLVYRKEVPREPDGDILIVEGNWEARLRPLLRQRYRRHGYLLRPGEPIAVYVNERLEAP